MAMMTRQKATEFTLSAPHARKVILAGSFNNWNTSSLLAKKDSKGNWAVKVNLKPGRYEYKFLVDGSWINDPKCRGCISNNLGTQNCVVEVK